MGKQSVFEYLIKQVYDFDSSFKIDLEKKNLKVDNKFIIKNGDIVKKRFDCFMSYNDSDWILNYIAEPIFKENPYKAIEIIYEKYKHSTSSKHKKKSYFKSLEYNMLTIYDLSSEVTREALQAMLEGYVLCASLQGWLTWNNDNHWFWQSKQDKDLVILKQWIERSN